MSTGRLTAKEIAKRMANAWLEDVVQDVNATLGAKAELSRAMGMRREVIERWTHSVPERRQQPLLGGALLLRETWRKQKNETKGKNGNGSKRGNKKR